MTQEQQRDAIRQMMQQHMMRVTVSKEAALAAMVEDGVYTPDGQLTPEFGGEEKNVTAAR